MKRLNDKVVLIPEHKAIAVQIDDPALCKTLAPAELVTGQSGQSMALMPWHIDSCKVLSNAGYDMTGALPFEYEYHPRIEGEFKPMPHQVTTAAFIILHPRCFTLSEPRTGKTGCLILAMDYLSRARCVTGGFLIVTTMTTMRSVWADAIKATLPNVRVTVIHGKDREELLKEPADFYITNYDSVRLSTKAFAEAEREGRIGAVVVDEVTHAGNISSQRWKALNAIINRTSMAYAVGLTGSPGENPYAALGMGMLINPSKMPCQTKKGWERHISFQWGNETWKRTLFADADQKVFAALQPAIRYKKADIISLPPVLKQRRSCELSAAQRKVMQALRSEGAALLESGAVITAVNGGVLYGKMLQCALGFAVQKDGTVVDLPHEDRTQTIVECIQETTRKVVVFISYKHAIRQRCEEIRKSGMTCEFIDGSVTGKARADILHRFQTEPDPHVLICQPVTTSFGVEMSAADTIVFDGPVLAGGFTYTQALERLSSARQTAESISVISVLSEGAERKAWDSLDNTHKLGYNIAKLFEQAVKE